MTKEPHGDPVPPDVPPIESLDNSVPDDDTMPAAPFSAPPSSAPPSSAPPASAPPFGPAPFSAAPVKPVLIGRRPRGKLSKKLVTAYFAGGLALLLAGTVAVFYLAVQVYGQTATTTAPTARGSAPAVPVPAGGSARGRTPAPIEPSGPLRARFGPERLKNGEKFLVVGEGDAKFEVTVKAKKLRRSACSPYAVKPELGGYLPAELTVKVLQGEPDVSEYDFRVQQADGSWLPSVGGSACEKGYGSFVRRLSAGRTYRSTIVFDVPDTKGDIVFQYPLIDIIASWNIS